MLVKVACDSTKPDPGRRFVFSKSNQLELATLFDVCLELKLELKAQIDELKHKAGITTDQYMINAFIETVRQAQSRELTNDVRSKADRSFLAL